MIDIRTVESFSELIKKQRDRALILYLLERYCLVAADLAVESRFDVFSAFGAFRVKFGHTAQAARRMNSGPFGSKNNSLSPKDFMTNGRRDEYH